jgi:DNA-binding MarR family transcriptional regulator
VERTRVPEDRRIVLIRVTDAGERMLREIDALSDELLRSVLGHLDRSKLAGVRQAFTSLRDAVSVATGTDTSQPSPRKD